MESSVLICIIATFLKISMQHNLYLRRILPCRFVHFAAGGYSHRKVRSAWSCTALKQSAQVLFPVFLACAAKLPIFPASLSCIWNYSIWQAGDTLFGYYECDDLQTALAVQKDAPVSARWRTYMRDVIRMERDPKSGAQPHLKQVFFFGCDACT